MKSPLGLTFVTFVTIAFAYGGRAPAVAAGGGTQALLPAATTVHIKDFRYTPNPVRLRAGERVTFINDDDDAHTITAADTTFDSAGLDTGEAWQHVFAKAGTYRYFCQLHPYMRAEIVVSATTGNVP